MSQLWTSPTASTPTSTQTATSTADPNQTRLSAVDMSARGGRRSRVLAVVLAAVSIGLVGAMAVIPPSLSQADGAITGGSCAPGVGVTVVVDFTSLPGGVVVGCAPGQQASGFAALTAAGFTTGFEGGPGMACTINGQPAEGYPYCWTTGGYWSYWKKARGGSWGFSPTGGAAGPIPVDAIEGWSWAGGFKSTAPGADEVTAPPTTTTTTTTTTTVPQGTVTGSTVPSTTTSTPGPETSAPGSSVPGTSVPGTTGPGSTDPQSTTTVGTGSTQPGGRPPSAGGVSGGSTGGRPLPRTGSDTQTSTALAVAAVAAGGAALAMATRLRMTHR